MIDKKGYWKLHRILITGSNGFVGTNIVLELMKNPDFQIRCMIQPGTSIETIEECQKRPGGERIEVISGDLTNMDSLEKACTDVWGIVHLAALVSDWAPKALFIKVNVDGTRNLLDAASRCHVKRVVYMSSLTVHDLSGHHYDDESAPRDMKFSPYGVSKILAEDLVQQWAEQNHTDYANVRPGFDIYGVYDRNTFIGVIDALKNKGFGFMNHGKALISIVYAENLAYGVHLLLTAAKISGAYNILDTNMTWYDFIKAWCDAGHFALPKLDAPYWLVYPFVALLEGIYKLFRIKTPPKLTYYRINITRHDLAFKNEKAVKELGYKPIVDFHESLQRTLKWYDILKGNNSNASK